MQDRPKDMGKKGLLKQYHLLHAHVHVHVITLTMVMHGCTE